MAKKIMTVEDMRDHQKWLEVRRMGLGGSDASVIAGVNRWKTKYMLWLEKTAQVEPEDISDKEPVYWGNMLEQVVAEEFCRRTGKRVRRCGTLQDDEYDFLLANVDRMIDGDTAGLECKTANGFAAKDWEGDQLPDAYYLQCQHYMMVTGCTHWYIACLIGGQKFVYKCIPRNDDDIKLLRQAEVDFWHRYVEGNETPEVDGSDDCTNALSQRFKGGNMEEVDLTSDEMETTLKALNELEGDLKLLNERKAELQNRLKEKMGDHELARVGETQLSWKTAAGRTTIDTKKLQKEHPDIYETYKKTGNPYRIFKIKA